MNKTHARHHPSCHCQTKDKARQRACPLFVPLPLNPGFPHPRSHCFDPCRNSRPAGAGFWVAHCSDCTLPSMPSGPFEPLAAQDTIPN